MTDYMAPKTRPIGITLLSILALTGGVLLAGMLIVGAFFVRWDSQASDINKALEAVGIPLPLLIGGIIFLAVLGIESGIEMWKGSKWGWYLGSFWYAYAIVRNLNALWAVYGLSQAMPPEELARMSQGPSHYYVKYTGRLIVSLLLYFYFFKSNVRAYFGLAEASRWKAVVAEFAVCIGIGAAVSVAAMMIL